MMVIGGLSFLAAGGTFALLNSQEIESRFHDRLRHSDTERRRPTPAARASRTAARPARRTSTMRARPSSSRRPRSYPGIPRTATVAITDNGSLDGSDLSVYMPSCSNTLTPAAPTHGGGNPCALAGAQLYIQETNGATTTCLFPAAAGACSFVANTLYLFAANYSSSAGALHLGAIAHGQVRTFVIGMQLPSDASNNLQGQAAQFGLTWHITS